MNSVARLSETTTAICDRSALDATEWDDLFVRARMPQPYYGRHVLDAHAGAELLPPGLRFVTVRSGGRLDALLPFRLSRDVTALGGHVARPLLTPFITASLPLVADGPSLRETMGALVSALPVASNGRAWRWPLLPSDGPVGSALLAAMRDAGWQHDSVASFARPILDRRDSHDAFLSGHPHRSRFKDLRRRHRRLAETGTLALISATEGAGLGAMVEAFLVLERAGWKGEAGSAMACRAPTSALARTLFAPIGGPVAARADALTLDGRPIAISLALSGGGTATLLKTAFDECLRNHAPGLLLEAEIVRLCHETGFADRLDSATLAGSALESLYRESETIAEIIALPPGADGPSLARRVRLAQFEARARMAAKRALKRR